MTVPAKYQVVIPRRSGSLSASNRERFQVLRYENRNELIPVKPLRKMRGFLRGLDTEIERDKDRV